MARRKVSSTLPLQLMQTWFAAAETIVWRFALISSGRCTPAEYQRMWMEKWSAAMHSGMTMALPPRGDDAAHIAAVLAPWRRSARANARRLRRK